MPSCQAPPLSTDAFKLRSERVGPLPLINRFLDRLGLEDLLDRLVPTQDRRVRLPYAKGLGLLLRSILVEREAIYRQQEIVRGFWPEAYGLTPELVGHAGDDAIGRALERLFDADRAALLTEVVLAVQREFALGMDELHNDSTLGINPRYPAATSSVGSDTLATTYIQPLWREDGPRSFFRGQAWIFNFSVPAPRR